MAMVSRAERKIDFSAQKTPVVVGVVIGPSDLNCDYHSPNERRLVRERIVLRIPWEEQYRQQSQTLRGLHRRCIAATRGRRRAVRSRPFWDCLKFHCSFIHFAVSELLEILVQARIVQRM
jgi:hypothetical protein